MRNKWLIAALVVSMVVNLALAGFTVGRMTRDFAPLPGLDPMVGVVRLVRFLEEDRRREVVGDLWERRRELRPSLRAIRGAQRDVAAALTAEPFDEAALRGALEGFRERLERSQARSHEMLATVAARLTPEERAYLARALSRPGPRTGHRAGPRAGPNRDSGPWPR